jgi:hypothetical protein
MLKLSQAMREETAKKLLDFIRDHPDAPLCKEHPNPAKEFKVYLNRDSIEIAHPTLPPMVMSYGQSALDHEWRGPTSTETTAPADDSEPRPNHVRDAVRANRE